ncbi:aminoglycoside adenylyltransferase domain-containing protein [Nocardia sp. NPDC058176]|uniref:aminoglycoside adenylyltransferase domain-containing protein n=1 Tax=Nocardia sp. NPDC058176 TaxID=3346368 RepID=UPI0036DDD70C
MDAVIERIRDHLDHADPGGVVGVYLFGSAVTTRLRPSSDIDLLVLLGRSLTTGERAELTALLLEVSGWHGHRERFPEVSERRPVEVTCVVVDADRTWLREWRYDFQFGEWLREDIVDGLVLRPGNSPDVVTLIATAHAAHQVLRGPPLAEVVGAIPAPMLHDAVLASIPEILAGIDGDERNALLTSARMLVTLTTGEIVSKDRAAELIAPTLDESGRWLLERARRGYLERTGEDWSGMSDRVRALVHELTVRARRQRPFT